MPTTLRGKAFPGAVDCIVADFSDGGARLTFEDEAAPGDHLLLVIWSTGVAFESEIRWRDGCRLGVQFLSRCDFRSNTPAAFHEAREIWRKSRPKLKRAHRVMRSPMLGAPS